MLVGVARVDSNLSRQVCFLKTPLKFLGYRSYRIQWNLIPTLCQGILINYDKERSHYMPTLMHLSSVVGEDSVFLCGSSLLIAALFQKFVFCSPYLYPSIYILDCQSVFKTEAHYFNKHRRSERKRQKLDKTRYEYRTSSLAVCNLSSTEFWRWSVKERWFINSGQTGWQ